MATGGGDALIAWYCLGRGVKVSGVVSPPGLVSEPITVDGVIWGNFFLRGGLLGPWSSAAYSTGREPQQRPRRTGWLGRLLGR